MDEHGVAGSVRGAAAAQSFLASGLLMSRFVAEPLYDVVMGWSPQSPPGDWATYRQRWWYINLVRAVGSAIVCTSFLAAAYRIAAR